MFVHARCSYTELAEWAAENFGYVSANDARELGIPMGTLNALRGGDS